MIRNVIILDVDGQPIYTENFGECHSLPHESDMAEMLSGFISALYTFGKNLTGQGTSEVNFGSLRLLITTRRDIVFVLAVDDDLMEENKITLDRIAELFVVKYNDQLLGGQSIDEAKLHDFSQILVTQDMVQDNCGDFEDCSDCSNSNKSLPVKDLTQALQNS